TNEEAALLSLPIDGVTDMIIKDSPLGDTFIFDTIPPVGAPRIADVRPATPSPLDPLATTDLPGLRCTDFISAVFSDTLTGSAGLPAGVPGVVNPLPPNNFTYTPWGPAPYVADNRVLTYATRSGRPAKVFFNDLAPLELSLVCSFYDPPAEDVD